MLPRPLGAVELEEAREHLQARAEVFRVPQKRDLLVDLLQKGDFELAHFDSEHQKAEATEGDPLLLAQELCLERAQPRVVQPPQLVQEVPVALRALDQFSDGHSRVLFRDPGLRLHLNPLFLGRHLVRAFRLVLGVSLADLLFFQNEGFLGATPFVAQSAQEPVALARRPLGQTRLELHELFDLQDALQQRPVAALAQRVEQPVAVDAVPRLLE